LQRKVEYWKHCESGENNLTPPFGGNSGSDLSASGGKAERE